MKPRPRAVENRVAAYLTDLFVRSGMSPVERIPVLGRTGPDITTNELKLVVDVKSRLECPKSYFGRGVCEDQSFTIIPLGNLIEIISFSDLTNLKCLQPASVIVARYWSHMDEWTRANEPDGITGIVMHRPKMPVGKAVLIISKEDVWRFINRWKQLQSQLSPLPQA